MSSSPPAYDVAIIGSGIAGSALAAILARQGLRTIVFEAGSHPRFAIGESMILETSEVLRAMAAYYDVPELAYFSAENYLPYIGTSHGVKRHFSFLHHDARLGHASSDPLATLQAVIPRQPHGHELHLYRQDCDYLLLTTAVRYGATVRQQAPVRHVEAAPGGMHVRTADGTVVTAAYVVDGGGFRSVLAEALGLRRTDLQTHSRAIFTHLVGVPCYHDVGASRRDYGLPFRLSEGTLHHVFDGGWLWVIPFNNHARATNPLCSVGLMLDPRRFPPQPNLTPEEEFYAVLDRFPAIRDQFRDARAVRDWTRTGRIQYGSTHVVGDRWCLLGHAAGFVDPLFSKGLYASLLSVSLLADVLLKAHADGDYSGSRFQPVEDATLAFLDANDRLIAHAYRAFADRRLWSAFLVLWLLGAYTELLRLFGARARAASRDAYTAQLRTLRLVGGGFAPFDVLQNRVYALLDRVDLNDDAHVAATATEIRTLLDDVEWMPYEFRLVLHGRANHLARRKFTPRIFRQKGGPLGRGAFRKHFYNSRSLLAALRFLLVEKVRYATPTLRLRRRVTRQEP